MNIIHLIEKIPFIEWEILEHFGLPYMVILYLIDAYCTYRMCKSFNDPVWTSFIPFYNWIVVFRHCWNLKALYEHLAIEICGLALPFIIEEFVHQETWIRGRLVHPGGESDPGSDHRLPGCETRPGDRRVHPAFLWLGCEEKSLAGLLL